MKIERIKFDEIEIRNVPQDLSETELKVIAYWAKNILRRLPEEYRKNLPNQLKNTLPGEYKLKSNLVVETNGKGAITGISVSVIIYDNNNKGTLACSYYLEGKDLRENRKNCTFHLWC